MLGFYYRFLGINSLNDDAKRFILRSTTVILVYLFVASLTSTFFILYALEQLNDDYALFGFILAVQFFVEALTDYPTGAIGDWIGQRWILFTSAIVYCFAFLALSQATGFTTLLIAFVLLALARSQESGAYRAFFDNNYKLYAPEDTERKIYMELNGKFGMVMTLVIALTFTIGGVTVIYFGSRSIVFLIQGILMGGFAFVFLLFVRDHPGIKRSKPDFKDYFSLLGEGITTTWKNRTLKLLILSAVIGASGMTIWGHFILFPMYESYGKTDDLTGLLRSLIFVGGALIAGVMGVIAKRIRDPRKWLIWTTIFIDVLFFWTFFVVLTLFPADSTFNPLKYVILILIFTIVNLPRALHNILMSRLFLDIVPDKNRNSVYSLLPTTILIASIITISVGGHLINVLGVQNMIFILGVWGLFSGVIAGYAVVTHEPFKGERKLDGEIEEIEEKNESNGVRGVSS